MASRAVDPPEAEHLMKMRREGRLAPVPGSAHTMLYGVRVEVVGDDRLSCSAHLRAIADMIMRGDAPGWSSSDINGSAMADRFAPNDKISHTAGRKE